MESPARTRTHKVSGWTRTPTGAGGLEWTITPTDGTGDRVVVFLSAHTWQNIPGDDRANVDRDRVVQISGDPLPDWAIEWLTKANALSCQRGRDALRAAIEDADWHQASREGW